MTCVREGTSWQPAEPHWPSHQAHMADWAVGGPPCLSPSPQKLTSLPLGSCPFPPAARTHPPCQGATSGLPVPTPSPVKAREDQDGAHPPRARSLGRTWGGGHCIPKPHKNLLPGGKVSFPTFLKPLPEASFRRQGKADVSR